jgi:predicted secreted hydrolase
MEDIGARAERLGKGDALAKQAAAVGVKLTAVENQLTNPEIVADEDDLNYEPKLDHDWVYLAGIVSSADAKPLASSVEYYKLLTGRLEASRAEYRKIVDTDVKAFNQAVTQAGIPAVAPAPKLEK